MLAQIIKSIILNWRWS